MIVQFNPEFPKWMQVIATIIGTILMFLITTILVLLFLDLVFNFGLIVH